MYTCQQVLRPQVQLQVQVLQTRTRVQVEVPSTHLWKICISQSCTAYAL